MSKQPMSQIPAGKTMHPAFVVHRLTENGLQKAASIASMFNDFLGELSALVPSPSREFSLVVTKLEEACFFAKKAMASDVENQDLAAKPESAPDKSAA